ncbi:MAG: ABC transporter permease [Candidatus Zixiibacteriota bacterium]|nr:MAG: ABC transporter permease [candidate division Zixibacteria bacterium]
MYKHYWKVALRHTLAHKGNSLINVAGLAIALACCLLIMLWVLDEVSYDRYHANLNRICRLGLNITLGGNEFSAPRTNLPTAPILIKDYPEVIDAVRFYPLEKTTVRVEDKMFTETQAFLCDSSIFDIFSFPLIYGDSARALTAPYSVVLTRSVSRRLFGDQNPVGKQIVLENDDMNKDDNFVVTGVVEDVPPNSHFKFSILCSMSTAYAKYGPEIDIWQGFNYFTYLLLDKNATPAQVESKFPALVDQYMGENLREIGGSIKFWLQPLSDVYLYSNFNPAREIGTNGSILHVYIFSIIAAFVLLIACFNFINLTTAHSLTRAKEIGLRKTLGADRPKLMRQFLFESVLYSLAALIISILIVEMVLPRFSAVTGKTLSLSYLDLPLLLVTIPGLVLLVGLLAGSYPAFYLSRFRPASALKGIWDTPGRKSRFRNVLVIYQFTVAIALIITTVAAYEQVKFMRQTELGFDKEQVVVVKDIITPTVARMATIRQELTAVDGVTTVAFSTSLPGEQTSHELYLPEGFDEKESLLMSGFQVDPDFLPAFGVELAAGRNFSPDFPSDSAQACIINEAAVRRFGWENAVGKTIKHKINTDSGLVWQEKSVIGVVKDFHYTSLHSTIEPLFIEYVTSRMDLITLRIESADLAGTIAGLERNWGKVMPDRPFEFYFLDEKLDSQYRAELRLSSLLLAFTLLAIVTGCLGLIGLALYMAEQRTKEIGIRKVLGASSASLVQLMTKEFMVLIVVANAVAWPAAYFVSQWWLEKFAYRIELSWGLFVLSGMTALGIALISVSYQAIRAAVANPIDSIRYE